jgi:predicted phage terminase large subunit-like protein
MTGLERIADAILREDFYSFVQAAFPIVVPGQSFAPSWHVEAITHALTQVFAGETRRLLITVPPRHLKSLCASVAFPAYALGHDPTKQLICVSYSDELSSMHANSCRALMHSSLYRRLFPATRISPVKDTEREFVTTARGRRFTTSVGGTLTGRGGSIIIIDDPLKPKEAYSETIREKVKQWYANTLLSRLDDKTKDAIVVVMQRLHMDDLAGHLLEQGGWIHLNLPAKAEAPSRIALGAGRYHDRKEGELLNPAREPQEALDELKRGMGSTDFSAQYQQQPIDIGGNLIKWGWFKFYDDPPAHKPNDRIVVSWDTAMSDKELNSYSVGVVMQVRGGTVFVLDVVRERLDYPDLKRKVKALHAQWSGANYTLLIENKGSGLSLIQDLRRENIHAIAINPEESKVMRMNAHTAPIEAGAVWLPRRARWLEEFRHEISSFPSGRHNDQVDAFSQGLDRAFKRSFRGESTAGHATGLLY